MSRAYDIEVMTDKLTSTQLSDIMAGEFGWEETQETSEYNYKNDKGEKRQVQTFIGTGYLCGGTSEEDCFIQIKKEIKKQVPECKVKVRLTDLENIPSNRYGDVFND